MSMKSKIESLLFISNRPLSIKQIAEFLGERKELVAEELKNLIGSYNTEGKGIHIMEIKGWTTGGKKYQLITNPNNSDVTERFVKEELSGELTRPSLETLTIIAYRGPISKAEIEQIRGVNCSLILKNLLLRGLIEERDDKEKMANYYNITSEFLRHLGVHKVEELPDYERLSGSEVIDKMLEVEQS